MQKLNLNPKFSSQFVVIKYVLLYSYLFIFFVAPRITAERRDSTYDTPIKRRCYRRRVCKQWMFPTNITVTYYYNSMSNKWSLCEMILKTFNIIIIMRVNLMLCVFSLKWMLKHVKSRKRIEIKVIGGFRNPRLVITCTFILLALPLITPDLNRC